MINIFIEAQKANTPEHKFIETLLFMLFGNNWQLRFTIIPVNGKDNLANVVNKFKENSLEDGQNMVVFDADYPSNLGGFDTRQKELFELRNRLGINFELFLFPNNIDDGDFELLLQQLINQKHSGLLSCFKAYETCVDKRMDNKGEKIYTSPNQKAKMYAYISSMNHTKTQRDDLGKGSWQFENKEFWDFNNEYLLALKNFFLASTLPN